MQKQNESLALEASQNIADGGEREFEFFRKLRRRGVRVIRERFDYSPAIKSI